ncbi:hypothetical protein IJJ97_04630, partial [bacterium]|nr:hypothetical protein [bacterium]
MSENLDEKKIEIKSSLLISIIVFAVFLLITVVFLIGFLVGSDRKKENIHTTTVITQKEDNIKQNKKDENFSTQKEEDKDEALKRLGFIPHGSKKEDSNSSSKSDESKDTRNLSALFSSVNEQDSNGFQSNITSNATTSNQITSSSTYTNSSSQNYNISSDSGREAVKNYFMELELKLAGSKTWNDPNQFAEQ